MIKPQINVWELPLLIAPAATFFDGGAIYEHTPFLLIVALLCCYYFGYPMKALKNSCAELGRRATVLACGAWLTIVLIGEI